MAGTRLVVVANRLPVNRTESGWEVSPGGLVSAVMPVLQDRRGVWVGWTGAPDDEVKPFRHEGMELRPVRLSQADVDNFYLGFCNGTLWPLYHDALRPPDFHRHWWRPYVEVNRRFAEAAAAYLRPGDVAWIHDYQLQLVPAMLRELRPDVRIGYYLHIPFPPVEIFARLPWRRHIVEGLLGADVIAFQTSLAKQNFARAAGRFTSAGGSSRALAHNGRTITLQKAPISIDAERYNVIARRPEVVEASRLLRKELGEPRTVVLGVDRLDYTKGIDVRLRAFETLLERHSGQVGDFVFVQISVPSREGIIMYAAMRERVEYLVGRINGAHAQTGIVPVHYLYRNLPAEELVAHYLAADVMCVTPLRDGMNLVAKEYVAARADESGVLVLSEFAGAAQEFRNAILVNPHDLDGVAAALDRAVTMSRDEQRRRMAAMRRHVRRHDVFAWAQECLGALDR